MQSPWAFDAFKRQTPFSVRSFIYTLLTAGYQSCVFYFVAHFMFLAEDVIHSDGRPGDMSVMGNMVISAVVVTTNLTMLLALASINYVNTLAMLIGFVLFIGVFIFESATYQISLAPDAYGMGRQWQQHNTHAHAHRRRDKEKTKQSRVALTCVFLVAHILFLLLVFLVRIFGAASSWFYILLCAILCLLPNAVIEVWYKLYSPLVYQTLQHIPPELIAAREAAEKQAVADAARAVEEAAKAASAAVAASKASKRRAAAQRNSVAAAAGVSSLEMAALPPAAAAAAVPRLILKKSVSRHSSPKLQAQQVVRLHADADNMDL